ncbi:SDR family NAD(P)-dependent oxidoreductase [Brenneria corticis]|uniref:Ketoreductase domain-containing protein n=1 Tax=Brenneria corticis TaxID=2173106 RepID=A0A2U1TN44_9GAMM|nr:SDR family oxidoreductase [Brenneria sp. CFCC 11842]PWC10772.1 hypothetical protein DDT56_21010 [Brenneria sp. CFCC 11842]
MSQSVVITGAARGIGRALTDHFIQQGKYHVIAIVRNDESARRLQQQWDTLAPARRVTLLAADFADAAEVSALAQTLSAEKNIAVFINNAGIFHAGGEDVSYQQLVELTAVNFLAPVRLTQAIVDIMKNNQSGYIFNIVSNAARRGLPGIGAYSASKHALLGFSESLRLDLLPYHIKVSNINPAFVDTDMTRDFPGVAEQDKIQTADVVNCIDFLLSLSPGAIVPNIDLECGRFFH